MADPTQLSAVVWIGVLLGVFVRTMVPYWNKHAQDGSLTWDWKYLLTAVLVFIGGIGTAQELVLAYVPPAGNNLVLAFMGAFLYAMFLNHVTNEALDKGKGKKKE